MWPMQAIRFMVYVFLQLFLVLNKFFFFRLVFEIKLLLIFIVD